MAHLKIFRSAHLLQRSLINISVQRQTFFKSSQCLSATSGIHLLSQFIKNSSHLSNVLKLSVNNSLHGRTITTSPVWLKKRKAGKIKSPAEEEEVDPEEPIIGDEVLDDPYFEYLRREARLQGLKGGVGARGVVGVMVVQPWVKWGPQKKTNTSGQSLLEEAVALISTLEGASVTAQDVVSVKSVGTKTVFGSGTVERLATQAQTSNTTTCIFISVNMLKKIQLESLEEVFKMRVVDRYTVVLAIFHQHARTREARLQVALAELPYIRKRVLNERDRLVMDEREKRLKGGLAKLAGARALIRNNRAKSSLPTVAVVGYTNAGKTSLIRAISQDSRVEGRNQLFATLDVTAHGARLPCGLEVLFIDTVGFIQDIPTDLVASFRATLEDAVCSDVVIHVRDASHPDYELQGDTVATTLATLPLPPDTPIIAAANKVDLGMAVPLDQLTGAHLVSATTGQGVEELLNAVQSEVLRVTHRKLWKFSLPTGSTEIQWLRRATGIADEEIDRDDPQTTHVLAVLTQQELAAFERNFGRPQKT